MVKKLIFLVLLSISFGLKLNSQGLPISSFEAHYLKTGTYPNDDTNIWMGNGLEVQGVTNDGDNWYFTVTKKDKSNAYIWRIPKQYDLNQVKLSDNGVSFITFRDTPLGEDFWHWGDPDCYNYKGVDYLLIPIPGIIACFRADDLKYVNYANIGTFQDYVGWCAVGVDGNLYSSDNYADDIKQYRVDWEQLINSSNHGALEYMGDFDLKFLGSDYNELRHMQGGEFSENGELFYAISGSAGCDIIIAQIRAEPEPSDGIHVFETVGNVWSEISNSDNSDSFESYFSYTFDNNCACQIFGSQTPEGLTIWDLEDGSAPKIRGSLHVLLDHYNVSFCSDAVTFQHFSNRIYVDSTNGIESNFLSQTGKKDLPFKRFNDAYFTYPVWSGAQIVLKKGTYIESKNDNRVYNQRVLISSEGGSAIIKKQ